MPPEGIVAAIPSHNALQLASVELVAVDNTVGCVMVTLAVAVQSLLSVIVTVYIAADKPVAVTVACASLHKYV